MSSETPATHLARIKVTYPHWQFWQGNQTRDYWAAPPPGHPQQELLNAPDLPALEAKIVQAEAGRD